MKSVILDAAMVLIPSVNHDDLPIQDEGALAKAIGTAAIIGAGLGAGIHPGASRADSPMTMASLPLPRTIEPSYKSASQLPRPKILGDWSVDFIDFVKRLENSDQIGWKDGKWYPYDSYEGGMPTIGYGYKIRSDQELQSMRQGIDNVKAIELLIFELNESWDKVKAFVKSRYGIDPDTLSMKQREMLTEFTFNVGNLGKFPKFSEAVVKNDMKQAIKHYQRNAREASKKVFIKGKKKPVVKGGKIVPLARRNEMFHQRFFT